MNLGKLLGAGKSFFGGRKVVSYREDKHVYLPKFNAEKNPFLPKTEEKAPAPVAPAPVAAATKKFSAPVTPSAPAAKPVAAVKSVTVKASKPAVFSAQKPLRPASWTEKLNPFRTPEAVAAPVQRAEQTELSLNAVKVLHNDLSDADVEVVPVKSRTLAPTEAPRLTATREPLEFFPERRLEAV